jgi:hypothetical protein
LRAPRRTSSLPFGYPPIQLGHVPIEGVLGGQMYDALLVGRQPDEHLLQTSQLDLLALHPRLILLRGDLSAPLEERVEPNVDHSTADRHTEALIARLRGRIQRGRPRRCQQSQAEDEETKHGDRSVSKRCGARARSMVGHGHPSSAAIMRSVKSETQRRPERQGSRASRRPCGPSP